MKRDGPATEQPSRKLAERSKRRSCAVFNTTNGVNVSNQTPRFRVVKRSDGHHVLDTVEHKHVVGPFAMATVAQEAADKRNRSAEFRHNMGLKKS